MSEFDMVRYMFALLTAKAPLYYVNRDKHFVWLQGFKTGIRRYLKFVAEKKF